VKFPWFHPKSCARSYIFVQNKKRKFSKRISLEHINTPLWFMFMEMVFNGNRQKNFGEEN